MCTQNEEDKTDTLMMSYRFLNAVYLSLKIHEKTCL
jgi:hypothetical protein